MEGKKMMQKEGQIVQVTHKRTICWKEQYRNGIESVGQMWKQKFGRIHRLEREGTDRSMTEQALLRPSTVQSGHYFSIEQIANPRAKHVLPFPSSGMYT